VISFGNALNFFSRVFELPLPRNAQKSKVRTYFFLRAGADVRRFLVLFFLPPLACQPVVLYDIDTTARVQLLLCVCSVASRVVETAGRYLDIEL
jgi:hypothetical protein